MNIPGVGINLNLGNNNNNNNPVPVLRATLIPVSKFRYVLLSTKQFKYPAPFFNYNKVW